MLFYKAEASMINMKEIKDSGEQERYAVGVQEKTNSLFEKQNNSCFIFVSCMRHTKITLGIISPYTPITIETIDDFLSDIGIECEGLYLSETTMGTLTTLLHIADRNHYINNDNEIIRRFDIDIATAPLRNIRFDESIIKTTMSKSELTKESNELLCGETLVAEINRIYQGRNRANVVGHPVHYFLQGGNVEMRQKAIKALITALYQNGRLQSRRRCLLNFNDNSNVSTDRLNALYKSCVGGTMVVRYDSEDSSENGFARQGADVIESLCTAVRKHKNNVLTIFCLPKASAKTKDAFLEQLGAVTMISIDEKTAFHDRAKAYLRALAKEHGIRANKTLYAKLVENTGYSAKDLTDMFDTWHDKQLKTKIYTQYAEMETANKQVALAKPKGSAIEEITGMIGLQEAKAVIKQALDFYKAQKLFREKGFSAERPAMHMIFTGNPGTAKTTVARLFAQIMKDNDLLSVGDLYEVGRADLVGKYVGWTADIVKRKFKAAKGSVLFIDEAYSLVDDRDGLYGDEAINTIVQEMENNREDMVVIFAGYPDKMEGFLQKNPGLRSRITFHVPFNDYNADELCQITELMAVKKNMQLDTGTYEKLTPIFETAMRDGDFGNGRFVRNIFEKAVMKQASRLVAMDVDKVTANDIERLLPEDFETPAETKQEARRIGFGT